MSVVGHQRLCRFLLFSALLFSLERFTIAYTVGADLRVCPGFDLYATSNNFHGRPVYKEARAFLQGPAAEALMCANHKLREIRNGKYGKSQT